MSWRLIPEEFGLPLLIRTLNERFRAGVGAATVVTLTASATASLTNTSTLYLVDSTAGSVTVTLPAASTVSGYVVEVKKMVAANTVTIAATDLIDGAASVSWTDQYDSWSVRSTGSTWVLT